MIEFKSPARITLFLSIGELINGYHKLSSLKIKVPCLYDTISIEKSERDVYKCTYNNDISLIANNENLVLKARDEMIKVYGKSAHFNIELDKTIPIGAGLAGGSTNAATVLSIINQLLQLNKEPKELREIGHKLGKDIPFFLTPYLIAADDEYGKIKEINSDFFDAYMLIATPNIKVISAEAYKLYDKNNLDKKKPKIENILETLEKKDLEKFSSSMYNDFEKVILPHYPEINEIKEKIDKNALGSCLSGSGSSLLSLFNYDEKGKNKALNLAADLSNITPYLKIIDTKEWKLII
jgi:4-diphosphocytidyl-2-C-methyl-D-erythritol kinase